MQPIQSLYVKELPDRGLDLFVTGVDKLLSLLAQNISIGNGFFNITAEDDGMGGKFAQLRMGQLRILAEPGRVEITVGAYLSLTVNSEGEKGVKLFLGIPWKVTGDNIELSCNTLETTLKELKTTVVTDAGLDVARKLAIKCSELVVSGGRTQISASDMTISAASALKGIASSIKFSGAQSATLSSMGGTSVVGTAGVVSSSMPTPMPPLPGMTITEAPVTTWMKSPTALLGTVPVNGVALGPPLIIALTPVLAALAGVGVALATESTLIPAGTALTAACATTAGLLPTTFSKTVLASL